MIKSQKFDNLFLLDDDDELPKVINHPVIKTPKKNKTGDQLQKLIIPEDWISPLEYMLEVMNDENVDDERRDKMATAAAPFIHPRVVSYQGRKDREDEEKAKIVNADADWNNLLEKK